MNSDFHTLDVPQWAKPTADSTGLLNTFSPPHVDEVRGVEETYEVTRERIESSVAWQVGYAHGHRHGLSDGRATGYSDGYSAGHCDALTESRDRTEALVASITTQQSAAMADLVGLSEKLTSQTVELACEIAELVLQRELAVAENPGVEAIERAAGVFADNGSGELVVRLNPDDLDRLGDVPASTVPGYSLRLVADPAIESGGCTLDSGATRIDAGISSALQRVSKLLSEGGR